MQNNVLEAVMEACMSGGEGIKKVWIGWSGKDLQKRPLGCFSKDEQEFVSIISISNVFLREEKYQGILDHKGRQQLSSQFRS